MKFVKFLLVVLIILNIGILVYLTFFVEEVPEYTYAQYIDEKAENTSVTNNIVNVNQQKEIVPNDYHVFAIRYLGTLPKNYLYRSIYTLVNEAIPKMNSELQANTNISQYYNTNKKYISSKFGITDVNKFQILAQNLKQGNKASGYLECLINSESYKEDTEYVSFELSIKYDTGKTLKFTTYFCMTDTSSKPLVIFEPIKE